MPAEEGAQQIWSPDEALFAELGAPGLTGSAAARVLAEVTIGSTEASITRSRSTRRRRSSGSQDRLRIAAHAAVAHAVEGIAAGSDGGNPSLPGRAATHAPPAARAFRTECTLDPDNRRPTEESFP